MAARDAATEELEVREARRKLEYALAHLESATSERPAESVHKAERALDLLEAACCPRIGSWQRPIPEPFLAARTSLARIAIGEIDPRAGVRHVRSQVDRAIEQGEARPAPPST